jgi:MFS family permease
MAESGYEMVQPRPMTSRVMVALDRLNPFKTADTRRLAMLFAVVYFSQGMWYLPTQAITIVLKDRGLSAGQVATFFTITTVPWLIKPVYGLLSDFVPLFGYRRKSYFLLSSALAALAGAVLALMSGHAYWPLAMYFTLMSLGLAFTDVLTDAMMVENGKPRGLTGAFQGIQWAAINVATILVGVIGGAMAEQRNLRGAFAVAAVFPVISFLMALFFAQDVRAKSDREAFRETLVAIREAVRERSVWVVAGFIFFWTFSPSFGTPLLYYQTDVLHFSQQFIGLLGSFSAAASIVGALAYAPISRRVPLKWLIVSAIGFGILSTLVYLFYRDAHSAIVIDTLYGGISMITQLAFLDLAAKSCPRRVEATFFALLMSVYNGGTQVSQIVGGYLFDWVGYTTLIFISAGFTALAWFLVPLVKIGRIDARARAEGAAEDAAPA